MGPLVTLEMCQLVIWGVQRAMVLPSLWITGGQDLEFPPVDGHSHSERVWSPTVGLRSGKESCWEGNDREESSRMSSNEDAVEIVRTLGQADPPGRQRFGRLRLYAWELGAPG